MKRAGMSAKGFTLLEVAVTLVIALAMTLTVLQVVVMARELTSASQVGQLAWLGAQRKMETLIDLAFAQYDALLAADNAGDPNHLFTIDGLPGVTQGVVQVFPEAGSDPTIADVYVTVCFRGGQGRVLGEDQNLNGVLEGAEDLDGDAVMDSPVQLVTRLTRR